MAEESRNQDAKPCAPQVDIDYQELDDLIFQRSGGDKENLIMILQAISKRYNYLPLPALRYLSAKLGVSMSGIYEIVTFYSMFCLEPRGRNIISVCLGTACHVRGAERIKQSVEDYLGIKAGETTADFKFTLETVRCIGCCSLGPVVVIDEKYHGGMTSDKMLNTLKEMAN
ncbi:NADH dehydrogenase (ubiquinone) 24 kDa subunit [Desulfarculus baarsii DSM 2075]|uniref:NADH dehydrogenase (Ubiquinone) 24 kDa subunit n=1 Tax=Desulfarculus baarsii (strain ATCC 33931 / DSM 2075 / LMG 7858 / VKM B-1802 / 2st14) TaxID=644282 RepID=E1QME8_DESB2|nr:NAD(P)H-dependent oxidoreductase subunit E [Desulfarculus baarsii]ADK86191.1 NADH dehydrogenase (ubiquinone) 24 kDa subunit [Desulfarculus baarsii DSM 2075]